LFKHKSFSYGNLALILSYLPLCGNGIIYPIYAQHILGYSPFTTGLSMLPFSIVLTITAPISGTLAGRYGSRYLTVSGALLMGCSAFLFSSFNSKTTIIYILLAHATMGLANGLFQSPTNNAIFTHINRNQTGVASGVLGLARNTGMIIGTSSAIAMLEIFKNLQLYTLGENLAFMYAYKNTLHLLVFIAVICASVAFYAHGTKSEVRPQDLTKYQQP